MHRALVLSIAVVLLHPLGLRAEESDAADESEVPDVSLSADPNIYRNDDMIVIGRPPLRVEIFQDTPIQTEWISADEIRALPTSDAAGVVDYLAGIRTSQRIQGQEAAVSIEGMPVEYTQILVDGQRFSGEIGGAGDLADFSLENVDHIEVLRGAQGAQYGTDAAGGVINVVTRNAPSDGYRVGAQGEGGSDVRALGGATAAWRLGTVGLSLSGEYERQNGFDPPEDDKDVVLARAGGAHSTDSSHFLYGKWDTPLGERMTLRGNGLWRVEDNDSFSEDDALGDSHGSHVDTNWRGNTGFDFQLGPDTLLTSDLTYYAVATDSRVARDFELFEDEGKADLVGEHGLHTGPCRHVLRGGAELDWQHLDLNEGPVSPDIELTIERNRDEVFFLPSIYLLTDSVLTDWLTLTLGVRGRFHTDFPPKALPQVGVLVTPLDGLRLRASWGLNYRTPSLRDLYQPPTPQLNNAYFLSGNPDLQAEESMSVRAGFEWSPTPWLSVATTGFYNDIDDYIRSVLEGSIVTGRVTRLVFPDDLGDAEVAICEAQRAFFPNPSDWTPECQAYFAGEPIAHTDVSRSNLFVKQNLDSVHTWGAESQLRIRLSDSLQLYLDYTYLRTEVKDPQVAVDELPNEPEHALGARAVVTSPIWDTQLTTGFRWRGAVISESSGTGLITFADDSHETDPSYQLDFRIAQPLPFLMDGLRIHFDAINVTNERREDSYAIRGRAFVGGISGEFGPAR